MYFPYLKNFKSENLAIRTLAEEDKLTNVIPIINTFFEDVNTDWSDNNSIDKFIEGKFKLLVKTLAETNNKFIIVINDTFIESNISLNHLYDKFISFTEEDLKEKCIFGIYNKHISIVENDFFNNKSYALLYEDNLRNSDNNNAEFNILLNQGLLIDFMSANINNKVFIADAFTKQKVNKDYTSDDLFANNVFSYSGIGFKGFGDFTILPKVYSKSDGGNMNYITVATHLIYKDNNNLYVRHNICTPEEEPSNSKRVENVINQIKLDKNRYFNSLGIEELTKLTSTSLAKLKELTISHHIEKMNSLI